MYQTKQQKEIKEFFLKHKEESFTAVELITLFEKNMNKATVYRKLLSLEEEGFIRKVYRLRTNGYAYQYSCNCEKHLHLVCQHCNKIIHLECGTAVDFIEHIFNKHSFMINKNQSQIYGLCKDCQNA